MTGIVKSFDNNRGYGFINNEDIEKDIFVHYSEIKMDGFKKLYPGDVVEFEYDAEKVKASNVIIIKKNNANE